MIKSKYIIMIWLLILLIIAGIIVMWFFTEKKDTTEAIDSYITKNNYENNVKKKEMLFDSKQGAYYAKVIFKDEPENYYEMYVENNSDGVYVLGFDNDQNEIITDESDGKYINDN